MFCGEYRLSLDEKGRMRIPNKLRAKLGAEYVMYAGTSGSLIIVPQKDFDEKYADQMANTRLMDAEEQRAFRILCSTTFEPEEDAQGRFVLPAKLKTIAKIKKKMVFLGVIDRIEVWSEESYDESFDPAKIDMDAVVNTLLI